jgi:hypothetical protein
MKASALAQIERNIAEHGQHIYLVMGTPSPRYAYTIGITPVAGLELVLAGAIFYDDDEAYRIVSELAERLRAGADPSTRFRIKGLGCFGLVKARKDWTSALLLGAVDYYEGREAVAYQVLPDEGHLTNDVPDMTKVWSAPGNRAWTWFEREWPFAVPKDSVATTNLAALRGQRVTEAARWGEDEWELFAGAGPDVKPEDARTIPLGVLLGLDESLAPVAALEVGQALWRDDGDGGWNAWLSKQPQQ